MADTAQKPALRKPVFVQVKDLRPGTHGHNLVVKVVSVQNSIEKSRSDGSKIRIAEALVGDTSGCVILTARNEQIDKCQPGKTLTIRNAKIDMFGGFMRLAVDKWGKVESSADASFEVNQNDNLSNVEYELVTVNDE